MNNTDYLNYPNPSKRMTTFAKKGMVATSQPLAAEIGRDILKQGGNAVDAAIATAAALTVLEPTSNGLGSDAFALVWINNKLHGLNASGKSPQSISIEAVKAKGYEEMPTYGWTPVTVPGAPGAWASLSEKFGRLPFADLLAPAIRYAEEGYPISPILGDMWNRAYRRFKDRLTGPEYANWFNTFAPNGLPPQIGQLWRAPDHAQTLKEIAETKAESFYRGMLAKQITREASRYGGFITEADLAGYQPEWVDPISVNYRGYNVWEIPPNGQGIIALLGLNILKGFTFDNPYSVERYHKQIEAMKLAFIDGKKFITDPDKMTTHVDGLLSDTYALERLKLIGEEAAMPEPGTPPQGGTVYLATADQEGNMVSFIQSNYMGFGSGIVVEDTGISLQNRGADFSLDPHHQNALAGGKKSYHTIIPGFLTKDNQAIGPFGVMGGYMQPQGHLQLIMNTIDLNLNPQAALDAPRWQWIEGKKVYVEPHFPIDIAQALARKGHQIEVALESISFGRGQIIWRDPKTGVLKGGTESRTDGHIASW